MLMADAITGLASGRGVDLASGISVAVARKALDAVQQQGDAAVALIQAAAEVARAGRGPVGGSASANEGGGHIDLTA
jgi:hypothetical protein